MHASMMMTSGSSATIAPSRAPVACLAAPRCRRPPSVLLGGTGVVPPFGRTPTLRSRAPTTPLARAFPNDGARTAWTGDIDPSDRDGLLALLLQARQQQGAASAAAAAPCAATTTGANAAAADPTPSGRVYLVGTGPGDPGLLTLRAVQLLQRADVVLYDRLVSDDVLSLASSSALLVYAGKAAGLHTRPQEEIHHLLAAFAQAGATVVRLKGGDPFVFGRGGEEAAYLQAQGVEVRAVPGVTAAAGIAAELGIPLTHRGVATGVRFLTGHAREGGEAQLEETVEAMLGGGGGGVEGEENGEGSGGSGADQHTTLVVYMGLGTLPALTARLTGAAQPSTTEAAGGLQEATAMAAAAATAGAPSSRQQRRRRFYAPSTPAVAVERGTTDDQRVVFGTLADLSERATAAGLRSPTLIVVGSVVGLSPQWQAWEAEGRPLPAPASAAAAGQVPCARSELGDPLRELGLIKGGVAEREAAAVARPREGAAAAAV